MTRFVGLDVSQKITAICVVNDADRRLWRASAHKSRTNQHFGPPACGERRHIGIETGAMTPWLVHELRNLGSKSFVSTPGSARAALEMQINKTDQNRCGGIGSDRSHGMYRSVHVKSFESHPRALLFLAQGLNSSA